MGYVWDQEQPGIDEHEHYASWHSVAENAPIDVPDIGPQNQYRSQLPTGVEHDTLGIYFVLQNNTLAPINVSFLDIYNTTFLSTSNTYLYSGFTFPAGWDGISVVVDGILQILIPTPVVYANIIALVADLNLYGSAYGTWTVASAGSISVVSTNVLGTMYGIGVEDFTPSQTGSAGITIGASSTPYLSLLTRIGNPDGRILIRNMKIGYNSTEQSMQVFNIVNQFGLETLNYAINPFKYMDGGLFHPTIVQIPTDIVGGKQNIDFTMLAGSQVTFMFDMLTMDSMLDVDYGNKAPIPQIANGQTI